MPLEDLWERAIANSYVINIDKCFDTAIHGLEALGNLSSVFLPHFAYYPVRFVQQSFAYHLLARYRIFVKALGVYSRNGQYSFVSHDNLKHQSYQLPSKVNEDVWYFGSFRSKQESCGLYAS